jgi:hypothetical protein
MRNHPGPSLAIALSLGLLANATAGCSPEDAILATAEIDQALLAGASPVTDTTTGPGQAETAINIDQSTGHTIEVVAYNSHDVPPYMEFTATDRTVRTGASLMGYSVRVDGGAWTHNRLRPVFTNAWPVFWADPAVSQMPGTTNVYFMTLAIPGTLWPASGEVHGAVTCCVGGAVVARSPDSGQHISNIFGIPSYQFISNTDPVAGRPEAVKGHAYDGTALQGADGNRMYAAFEDTTTSQIDVWLATGFGATFSRLPNPFPGKTMSTHPRLRNWGANVYVAAVDTVGNLWLNLWNASTGSWGLSSGQPVLVASGVPGEPTVTLSNGRAIRGLGFSFDLGLKETDISLVQARFFYEFSWNGFTRLQGAVCNVSQTPVTCWRPANWATPLFTNAFAPAVSAAMQRIPPFVFRSQWKVSFQTDESASGGMVTLAFGNLDLPTADGTMSRSFSLPAQAPCPSVISHAFWGDYDYMAVLDNGTRTPRFVRPFTDSTGGTCIQQAFRGTPQHVSQFTFPP